MTNELSVYHNQTSLQYLCTMNYT